MLLLLVNETAHSLHSIEMCVVPCVQWKWGCARWCRWFNAQYKHKHTHTHAYIYSVAKCLTFFNGYASLRLAPWDTYPMQYTLCLMDGGWQQFDKSDFLCCQSIVVAVLAVGRRLIHFRNAEFVKIQVCDSFAVYLVVHVILENNYFECTSREKNKKKEKKWKRKRNGSPWKCYLGGWLPTFSIANPAYLWIFLIIKSKRYFGYFFLSFNLCLWIWIKRRIQSRCQT